MTYSMRSIYESCSGRRVISHPRFKSGSYVAMLRMLRHSAIRELAWKVHQTISTEAPLKRPGPLPIRIGFEK